MTGWGRYMSTVEGGEGPVGNLNWKLIISAAPLSDRVYLLSVAAAALELR